MRAAGAFVDLEDPEHGRITTVNSPIFSSEGEKQAPVPAPGLGDHTGEVLTELGYDTKEIAALVKEGVAVLADQ